MHLLRFMLLPVAHKYLIQSVSFISIFLSEQLIFSVLPSHVSRLAILPNFSFIFEVPVPDSSLIPNNLLVHPKPVSVEDPPC